MNIKRNVKSRQAPQSKAAEINSQISININVYIALGKGQTLKIITLDKKPNQLYNALRLLLAAFYLQYLQTSTKETLVNALSQWGIFSSFSNTINFNQDE